MTYLFHISSSVLDVMRSVPHDLSSNYRNRADPPLLELFKKNIQPSVGLQNGLNFNNQTSKPIKLAALSRFSLIKAKRYWQTQPYSIWETLPVHRVNNSILCRHTQKIKTYEKSMQIKLQQVERTLARQYVIFMNTTPMCQNLDSSPFPKQGGSNIHAVQKLGYTVLNMAPHRLIQEEVKLMLGRERERERESFSPTQQY